MINLEHFGHGDCFLKCPKCGIHFVHPLKLTCYPVLPTEKKITIDNKGVLIENIPTPNDNDEYKNVEISMIYWCESRHIFNVIFKFHEGTTIVSSEFVENKDPHDFEDQDIPIISRRE